MTNFTARVCGLRVASLLEVGARFRQSHGIEFAKDLIRQLGADEATVQAFIESSTSKQRLNGRAKPEPALCAET